MTFYFAFTQESMPRPTVSPALAVNKLGFLGALDAGGDQIYRLGNDGIWRYIRPEATLYGYRENEEDGGEVPTAVASHFGTLLDDGTGNYAPTWQQTYDTDDNSSVQATRVASIDAPDPIKDIPWLKLKVAYNRGTGSVNAGKGVFGGTQYIQRINTSGGAAPKDIPNGATPGQDYRVHYTATYCFWGANVRVRGGNL